MIEAAPLQRVVDLAGAVGGDEHDRRRGGADRADLRNGDLVVGQHLQQERLERLVGTVELVDQQHRRPCVVRPQRLQQRAADEEALGKDVAGERLAVAVAHRLRQANFDHLPRVVPLVDGRRDVEPFVTLEAQQGTPEPFRQHRGECGLADPGLALEEERAVQAEGDEQAGCQVAIRHVVAAGEQRERLVDGCRGSPHRQSFSGTFLGKTLDQIGDRLGLVKAKRGRTAVLGEHAQRLCRSLHRPRPRR